MEAYTSARPSGLALRRGSRRIPAASSHRKGQRVAWANGHRFQRASGWPISTGNHRAGAPRANWVSHGRTYRKRSCYNLALHGAARDRRPRLLTLFLQVAENLHRGRLWISIKNGIDVFHDISAYVEEVSLVLDWDERTLCAVVFRNLKRLS